MCTSFTLSSEDNMSSLTRTLDFPLVFDIDVIVHPRNYTWANSKSDSFKTKFAFIGMGVSGDQHEFTDGVNEKGLTCACLYHPSDAAYSKDYVKDFVNIPPHQVVKWILSSFESIDQVKSATKKLNILDEKFGLFGFVPPFHWIVSDNSGNCLVIESTVEGLQVYDNLVGVMANSPNLPWHITNLGNYTGLSPKNSSAVTFNGATIKPFGQGSGASGMPGDQTSPSRFIRTVFNKMTIPESKNEEELVNSAFQIMKSVNVTLGSVVSQQMEINFTQYTATMVSKTCSYYYNTYFNMQINKIDLLKEDLNMAEPKHFKYENKQKLNCLN